MASTQLRRMVISGPGRVQRSSRRLLVSPPSTFGLCHYKSLHVAAALKTDTSSREDKTAYAVPRRRVKLTCESYPHIERHSNFKLLEQDDVKFFETVVGREGMINGVTGDAEDDLESFNLDWMQKYRGKTTLVLKPADTQQVSAILKYCSEKSIAIVPQGGNTGLVGGSVPVFDEVVLNLSRMDRVRSFDDVSGVFVADAGVILKSPTASWESVAISSLWILARKAPVRSGEMLRRTQAASDC